MTITRRTLFVEISQCDATIAEYNEDKAGAFEAYREQLKAEGRSKPDIAAEITACKKAFRRLRALDKDADAVLEADALVDEIVVELQAPKSIGTNPATRVRRARPPIAASTSSPPTRGDEAAPRLVPSGAASPNSRSPKPLPSVAEPSKTGDSGDDRSVGLRDTPNSEAAPALGVVGGDRTDAASSHSAADPTQVTSLANGGGNLADTDLYGPAGHSSFETDVVGAPVSSIVEPAGCKVSIPSDEIEPVREAGFPAGSPIPDLEPRGGVVTERTNLQERPCEPRVESWELRPGPRVLDADPSLDIRTQPFYRGGETWPR